MNSFFKALNPHSENSGVATYVTRKPGQVLLHPSSPEDAALIQGLQGEHAIEAMQRVIQQAPPSDTSNQKMEFEDDLFTTAVSKAWHSNLGFLEGMKATFNLLVGTHYIANPLAEHGVKGALDYLFFPLLARKLLFDAGLRGSEFRMGKGNCCSIPKNLAAYALAFPLELVRFSLAVALTIALAPVVALTTLLRYAIDNYSCVSNEAKSHDSQYMTVI